MFTRYGKKEKSPAKRDLIRMMSAPLLLSEGKRGVLMQQIKESCALKPERFDEICLNLIHQFIHYCQNLPETSTSYYSQPGGVLDYALNRTEAALNLFKHYLLKDGQNEISEEQKLWQYALFTAAILKGIGKLQIDYAVQTFDQKGQLLKAWNPLLESLVSSGSYYRYELQKASDENFRHRLNLLLARLLMPAEGFAWIAQNTQVLAVWLALLNEDLYAAGTFGAILVRADAIAIQRNFDYGTKTGIRGGRFSRVSTFSEGKSESISVIEQQIGLAFQYWLMESLDAKKIMINKAPLLMVPGGMLMCDEIFQLFVREHPEYKNWQAVQKAFLSLGLHRLGPNGSLATRFEQKSGILCVDFAVLLPHEFLYHETATGKISQMTAVRLLYLTQLGRSTTLTNKNVPHLNAKGEWLAQEKVSPQFTQQPGVRGGV